MDETFGTMLRGFRLAASLPQEDLAEKARLNADAVAALERGRHRAPRLSTVRQLPKALDLNGAALASLARVASMDPGLTTTPV